jgi:Kef-type K+ transport system membrane component KefB
MSVSKVLLDILIVLLAAKAAAELAERVKVPAVVAEILAGVVIGPSALNLVGGADVLRVLGELGVILLLLDVGMEMNLAELAAVGRASLAVAGVGVAVPFVAGWGSALGLGMSSQEAMFVGAALTATSVGITARVFADLRALPTVEARTVLGAAVADDVIGLVILTVVVRIAAEGHVSALSVAALIGVAVGFLVVTALAGVRLAPPLFAGLDKFSRSSGTLVAVALAFTLAVAELASAAKLAPIVGAFVAGISLGRSPAADRIRRELTPVGHLFIPVFFLQIGIDAEVREFVHPKVMGLAAVLLLIAVLGKIASAIGLWGSPGDRLLVGLGMIPRGEVGLIFATIGLREGFFGQDVYSSLLLVVLATTLLTPPLLRWRLLRIRARPAAAGPAVRKPDGGWLTVAPGPGGGTVELAAEPPVSRALAVALEAALLGSRHRPGARLLDWLAHLPDQPLTWERTSRDPFFQLLDVGGPRSWRFLALTGVLDRALPELGEALARRQADPFELDPTGALRWPRLSRLQTFAERRSLPHPERLLMAALVLDATDEGNGRTVAVARRMVQRLDLGAAAEQAVASLVADANLLPAAARLPTSFDEEAVLQLAVHVRSAEQAHALLLLSLAGEDLVPWEEERLRGLHALLQAVLAQPEVTGREAANAVEQRRVAAARLTTDAAVRDRIRAGPRAYVLATPPEALARQAALCEPSPRPHEVRVAVQPERAGGWRIDVVARDRIGLLAAETLAFAQAGLDISDATIATWGDRCALASFAATSSAEPSSADLEAQIHAALKRPKSLTALPDATVSFDADASPWHTLCRVKAPDSPALLYGLTSAFAAAGASVHSARVATTAGRADDHFALTDAGGHKLPAQIEERIARVIAAGATAPNRRRWLRMPFRPVVNGRKQNGSENDISTKQIGDRSEISEP